jgi:hypothetical protein
MATRIRRHVGRRAALVVLIACGSLVIAGAAAARRAPEAVTQPATDVTATAATLHGMVTPEKGTFFFFRYGTTTEYGARSRVSLLDDDEGSSDHDEGWSDDDEGSSDDDALAVSAPIDGLAPSTTYHFELVAISRKGIAQGGDFSFITAPATLAAPVAPAPSPSASSAPPQQGSQLILGTTSVPPPVLGVSVNIARNSGSVSVRTPGAPAAVPVAALASLPFGSLIDTRHGSVTLRTALPGGRVQRGTFHGGLFQVRQGSRGFTELVLRGALPRCGSGGARAAAVRAVKRRRKPRRLWGKDSHGRFRTRGSNSVATVRGTEWLTEDRCAGTLTRVRHGRVSVRDLRRHRTVIVRAGHSYLARKRR